MDLKETGKKLKPFAPVLSVAVVASCVAGTLSGYQPPVYAAQEQTNSVKEETTKSEEQEQAVKGSFNLTDGVYKGTGTGYAGDITVAVQIKDRQITAIDILSSSDDAAFFKRAQAVIDKIIEGQALEVDTVSGATYSSRGIISAVKNALTGEKDSGTTGQSQSGGGAAAGSSTSVATVEDPAAYKDGTYYGTGTGFGGTLKVKVEISGGKITDIQIMENQDGSEYISKASALINAIISSQSTNVDTVSGATYSSVGIIQAVRDALSQAAVSGNGAASDSSETNGSNSSSSQDQSTSTTGTVPYKEGIYYGTAEGYSGDVSVAVVIQEHTIKAILVTETSDDIVMVMSDVPNGKAISKCFLINENNKYTLNQRICCLRTKENTVFYINQISRNKYFLKFDDGVKQTNLRKNDILQCPLLCPCLAEQQKIADCLASFDEVIEKQKATLAVWEELKKGLLQQMFV